MGDVDDGAVLLLAEVGALHLAIGVVKVADGAVGEEVTCLGKAEVHGAAAVVVEHDDIGVAVEAQPAVGSLVVLTLTVLVVLVEGVGTRDVL